MKKKHRRAVYDVLAVGIICPIYRLFYYPAICIWRFSDWLKAKLRVYDDDQD